MGDIRKVFLQFVFSGANMKRWNDKLRPMDLYEVDKHAHKMIVAWLLFVINSRQLSLSERLDLGQAIIEGGIFDYFYRLIITDIKPPVFYSMMQNRQHYQKLSNWVRDELAPKLSHLPDDIFGRFETWIARKTSDESPDLASRILDTAHIYASSWEFNIIKQFNSFDREIPKIDATFKRQQTEAASLCGAAELWPEQPGQPGAQGQPGQQNAERTQAAGKACPTAPSALAGFASLCGQLRFQARWSQTPRIPETSVLGHMFMVACYSYFFSLHLGTCRARAQNNFFAGLFHDLPELLTRDIISPVKNSVEGIAELLQDYEQQELEQQVFAPLRADGHEDIARRLHYFLGIGIGSEFASSVYQSNQARKVSFDELQTHYNADGFDPKDGELLKMCDHLAAFLEAYASVRNGIAPPDLQEAIWRIKREKRNDSLGNIHLGAILADFD